MEAKHWQTSFSTIRERTEYVFSNSLFCDVEFSVPESQNDEMSQAKVIVPACKFPLAVCSPVFEAMFYGKLAETKSPIDIPDCTKEGLQEILRYAHSEEANLTRSNVMEVLYLAKKYIMPFLEDKCKNYIQNEVGPEYILDVLPQIKILGDVDLEKLCWDLISNETKRVITSESFLNHPHEFLKELLPRDNLKIKELDLFQAVDKWAIKKIEERLPENCEKSKRDILGDEVVRLIRFPLMSQKEFAEFVLPSGILLFNEVTEILQLFNSVIDSATCVFSSVRRALCTEIKTEMRFLSVTSPNGSWWYNGSRVDNLDFYVSKCIFLSGFELFGSNCSSYEVDLHVYHGTEDISNIKITAASKTESVLLDGENINYECFDVYLKQPVRLSAGKRYTVQAKINGPTSYFGGEGAKKGPIVHDDLIVICLSSHGDDHTNIDRGQFCRFIFID